MSRHHSFPFQDYACTSSIDNINYQDACLALPIADDVSSSISSDQSVQDYNEVGSNQQSMGPPAYPEIYIEGEMSNTGLPQPQVAYFLSEGTSSTFSPYAFEICAHRSPPDSYRRIPPFPADAIPAGIFREGEMPGTVRWS